MPLLERFQGGGLENNIVAKMLPYPLITDAMTLLLLPLQPSCLGGFPLQHAEQLDLKRRIQFTDFVEKDRSLFGQHKTSGLVFFCLVNVPALELKSSYSRNVYGSGAQLKAINGPSCRALRWWNVRATGSLPVLVSPRTRILLGLAAIAGRTSNTRCIKGLRLTAPNMGTRMFGHILRESGPFVRSIRLLKMWNG